MVERRPLATAISHLVLILGVIVIAFPLYITFVASTRPCALTVYSTTALRTSTSVGGRFG